MYKKFLNTKIIRYKDDWCTKCKEVQGSDEIMPHPYYFINIKYTNGNTCYVGKICPNCVKELPSNYYIKELLHKDLKIIEKSNFRVIYMGKLKEVVGEIGFDEAQKLMSEIAIKDIIE